MRETKQALAYFEPGSTVGRFRILRKLATGGMGIVYEAQDQELGRVVALKHPRLDVGDGETNCRRFRREGRAASRLLHPNIVPIFEVFEAEGLPWIAMEMIEGESLRERIKRSGPMPLQEALRHAEDLASALAEAHRRGILHRDLKPENILIDSRGRARLMDFGLTHSLPSADREQEETITRLTGQGFMVGTPGYMSPEQALGRPLDARSDIFCLGLLLHEMLTGRGAFENCELDSWLENLLYAEADPIARDSGDLPEELEGILSKALAKDPKHRYENAGSFRDELHRLRVEVDANLTRKSIFGSRRRLRLISLLAVGGVMALSAALSWFGRGLLFPPEPQQKWVAEPLTHDNSWSVDPALSPDESMIAFSSARAGNGDIWLIDLEGGDPLQLTHDPSSERRPAWSPDGKLIYFTSFKTGTPAIWKIPRLGGTPSLVLKNADDPAISPDGNRLAFVRYDDDGMCRVALAPLRNPEEFRFLTNSGDGYWWHRHPRFSPDGKTISYFSPRGLWAIPTAGGRARRLYGGRNINSVAWANNSRLLVSMRKFRIYSIWAIDVKGGAPQQMTPGLGIASQVSPAADGEILTYSSANSQTSIQIVDRVSKRRSSISYPADADMCSLAPDGSAIVFSAPLRKDWGLFIQDLEGPELRGNPRGIMPRSGNYALPVFSPDGNWIAFQRGLDDQEDIWLVPREGGAAIQFTENSARDACPSFGPDGRYLYFSSDRVDAYHLWRAPLRDGRRHGPAEQLSFGSQADYLPQVSPDGSKLAWLRVQGDEENLWLRSLDGAAEPKQLTIGQQIRYFCWESRSLSILASGKFRGESTTLARIDLEGNLSVLSQDPDVDFGQGDLGGQWWGSGIFSLSSDDHVIAFVKTELSGDIGILRLQPAAS